MTDFFTLVETKVVDGIKMRTYETPNYRVYLYLEEDGSIDIIVHEKYAVGNLYLPNIDVESNTVEIGYGKTIGIPGKLTLRLKEAPDKADEALRKLFVEQCNIGMEVAMHIETEFLADIRKYHTLP